MLTDLNEAQLELANYMSQLSEEAFDAGWIEGLEFALWKLMNGEINQYGRLINNEEIVSNLTRLSNEANGWIVFDEQCEEVFVSFEVWKICLI